MAPNDLIFIEWEEDINPTEENIRQILKSEGYSVFKWSNDPNDYFSPHSHDYLQIFYVIEGSLTIRSVDDDITYEVNPGDRVEVRPGLIHEATIGPNGVVCLETQQ